MSAERCIPISPELARILDVARAADLPVLLIGSHGIGKSEFLEQYGRSRGLESCILDLSLLEPTDLTGLPYLDKGRTHFAPPALLPSGDAPALLVLEELNRCDCSVRQPCLQLLTTRRLNDYCLPRHCFLVACVNPPDAGYDVEPLDPALASRFLALRVEPKRDAWVEWARKAELHPGVVLFVSRFAKAFERVPPRTWTYAAHLVLCAQRQGWSVHELEVLLEPVLGPMTTRALLMELPDDLPALEPSDLLARPLEMVGAFRSWKDKKRHDIIGTVLESLRQHLLAGRGAGAGRTIDTEGLAKVLDLCPTDQALPILELLERR